MTAMQDIREGTCPRCAHNEIIEAWPRTSLHLGSAPLAVGWDTSKWTGPDPTKFFGQLAAFVCRQCGKTEWFAANPADIKIGPEYQTRLIQGPPKPETPYR